jgi:pyridinium-3,5-bisthiocarboxylic acid mononucleotide nickel chelatase
MGFDFDEIYVMESHIDDMNPEVFGFLMERLLAAGALDVGHTPIQMKKNRPGVRLTVICREDKLEELARIILIESTAIGVRYYPARRFKLERSIEERVTSLGTMKVKVLREGEKIVRVAPEYEECRRIACERGIPLIEVFRIVERETGNSDQ